MLNSCFMTWYACVPCHYIEAMANKSILDTAIDRTCAERTEMIVRWLNIASIR